MDERVKFIAAVLDGDVTMSSLCLAYSISRKTGYKWLERYEKLGPEGLKERSHAAMNCPHKVSFELERLLVQARKRRPRWGPRKLIAHLQAQDPKLVLPCHSTVSAIFKKRGLSKAKKRRAPPIIYRPPIVDAHYPNDVWGGDFKGDFKMQNGRRCNPLTISDLCSRFLLRCQSLEDKTYGETKKGFEVTFKEYGLPGAILTDNGPPFSSVSGLSQLSIWWIKLGIRVVRIEPGKPQQNGIHERMHRTLGEAIRPPGKDLRDQQRLFDRFGKEFNFVRPHGALGQKTPSSIYTASSRAYPKRLEELVYPNHFEIRKVINSGMIKLHNEAYFVSHALAEENVGLEPIDDGIWLVHFGSVTLGCLDETRKRLDRNTKYH